MSEPRPAVLLTVGGFPIDLAVMETHSDEVEITDHPVEVGADMTDHAKRRPGEVTIEFIVTDTPLGEIENLRSEDTLPTDDFLAYLDVLLDTHELVTVVTSLRTHTNMMLKSRVIPRDKKTGEALRGTLVFRAIRFVTNDRATVPVSVPRARNKTNRGNVPSTPAAPDGAAPPPHAESKKAASMLHKLVHGDPVDELPFGLGSL